MKFSPLDLFLLAIQAPVVGVHPSAYPRTKRSASRFSALPPHSFKVSLHRLECLLRRIRYNRMTYLDFWYSSAYRFAVSVSPDLYLAIEI